MSLVISEVYTSLLISVLDRSFDVRVCLPTLVCACMLQLGKLPMQHKRKVANRYMCYRFLWWSNRLTKTSVSFKIPTFCILQPFPSSFCYLIYSYSFLSICYVYPQYLYCLLLTKWRLITLIMLTPGFLTSCHSYLLQNNFSLLEILHGPYLTSKSAQMTNCVLVSYLTLSPDCLYIIMFVVMHSIWYTYILFIILKLVYNI